MDKELYRNLPSWDSLLEIERENRVITLNSGKEEKGPIHLYENLNFGSFYGESFVILSVCRIARSRGFPVERISEEGNDPRIPYLNQSDTWSANFRLGRATAYAVSEALAAAKSCGHPGIIALPNPVEESIYSRKPTAESLKEFSGRDGHEYRTLLGLRRRSKIVATHGRQTGEYSKAVAFRETLAAYDKLTGGGLSDLDFVFIGTQPHTGLVNRLRDGGSRVALLTDITQFLGKDAEEHYARIGANRLPPSNKAFLQGDFRQVERGHCNQYLSPFPVGEMLDALGAVAYQVRRDPGAFELSFAQMGLSVPVVSAVPVEYVNYAPKKKGFICDGSMLLIPPSQRPGSVFTYAEGGDETPDKLPRGVRRAEYPDNRVNPRLANRLAHDLSRALSLQPEEREKLVSERAEWIVSNFGEEAFAERLGRLVYLKRHGNRMTRAVDRMLHKD